MVHEIHGDISIWYKRYINKIHGGHLNMIHGYNSIIYGDISIMYIRYKGDI